MIIVTGGAGFIGSAIVWYLNKKGIDNIVIVDRMGTSSKWKNLNGLSFIDYMEKDDFISQADNFFRMNTVQGVIHMGACSSTVEQDVSYLIKNNFEYSKILAKNCIAQGIQFLYASSAATYGDGELGFSDNMKIQRLKPLNAYGYSKQIFDLWVKFNHFEDKCAGLKFFNVYGPNEYHKEGMRSIVCKAYEQIKETGKLKLFKSHRPDFDDGGQLRDFIYIKDVLEIFYFIWMNRLTGIWNVGTGQARSFSDLGKAIFDSLDLPVNIEYMDMPESIRHQYQYYTQSDRTKLNRKKGFDFSSLYDMEMAVKDYVVNYLNQKDPYLGAR